ncbi:MAG TPA: VWA domain-containing protein [Terracidiphilus sp.]|nr:VWA domain-containing protein [Terracidiphilus sp.]
MARPSRWTSLSVSAIVLLPGMFLAAQVTSPQQSASGPRAANVPLNSTDPRRAEIQPSLSVDRDPVPSPDIETPELPAASSNVPAHGPDLEKGKDGIYTLHQNVDEVLLSCTVVDEKGRPVEDLTQSDFRIWEDSVPQRTSSFRHQDLPVSMGILVDNSGSMRDKRTAVNGAAMNLLQESNRKDAAFIVNFNDRAYLDQGFTSDLVALHRGLAHFDTRGTTALYDAVAASADELSKHAKLEKQVLLIVSDGADNASRLNEQEAVRRVQNLGGPVVYTIGLLYDSGPKEYERARESLQSLSDDTGGIAYFPRSLDEVNKIASEVAEDIRNQYTVGYHSTKAASLGGYRVVHVEVYSPHHGKLTVRTRRGYYAKPAVVNQTAQGATPPSNP